jgi:hypothetical protein
MLDTLIAEVVEHIIGFLHDKHKRDLFAVRLVCRQLCLKSFQVFAVTWFDTIDSDLSQQSLRRLENIALHETLRLFVCHLRIGAGHRGPAGRPLGQGINWDREDAGCLDTSSVIVATFCDWLANKLVQCRSFEITNTCGQYPEQDGTSTSLSPADAVQLLFAATAGLPVHTFRIHQTRTPLILYPSQISLGIVKSIQFQGAWASYLLDLELAWDLEKDDLLGMALDLIVAATNLRRLSLSWHTSDATEQFFDSLGQAKTLPRINDLRINSTSSVTQRTLLGFLSRVGSNLTSLSLANINLSAGSWRSIFGDLQSSLPHLEQITYWNCYENPARGRIFFCPLRQNPTVQDYGEFQFLEFTYKRKRRLGGVRYSGKAPGMQRALNALEGSVYTVYQNGPLSPGYSDQKAVRKFHPKELDS